MTARQLAGLVAEAAREADTVEAATIAVLRTLRDHDAWLCHWKNDAFGFTLTAPFAPDSAVED